MTCLLGIKIGNTSIGWCYTVLIILLLLQETGEAVGTVVNVFDSGAGDLLQVMLNKSLELSDGTGKPKSDICASGPLVWVPFVEAIVPNVDMNKREMLITPPKGLLELNVRSDERSKKERRQIVRHTLFYFIIRSLII